MPRHLLQTAATLALLTLAACGDGNPFEEPVVSPPAVEEEEEDGKDNTPAPSLPLLDTGTTRPTQSGSGTASTLLRRETNAQVTSVSYDGSRDVFIVEGLYFDGNNVYARNAALSTALNTPVYVAAVSEEDFLTFNDIAQMVPTYALYGTSQNDTSATDERPRTAFSVVRSGAFVNYGPGGFIYTRNGNPTLPSGPYTEASAQATFSGQYAGMRVFNDRTGIELTRGDATVDVDFREANVALTGRISNRVAYTPDGGQIGLGPVGESGALYLPDVIFTLPGAGGNVLSNGEFATTAGSSFIRNEASQEYETGTLYGAIAGNLIDPEDGGEVVGILVLTSNDPRTQALVQETGGFIAYRQP